MLRSIFETCVPRDEVLGGNLSEDVFAAKLKQVVDGNAPLVYQDPNTFFANTFPTNGLKTLISEVFGRLTGVDTGSPVIRLETSFGGGKTHDEIAIWHIARNGRQISGLDRFVDDITIIPDRPIQVAAIACQDLDPVNGVLHEESGVRVHTLWGEIAYQIGGVEGYSLLRGSDEQKVSPGTVVIDKLTNKEPTVIILDEIAQYLRRAKAIAVGNSDLSEQVVAFLFTLMDLTAACKNIVFVYTLASISDTFGAETNDLREALQTSARQERVLSPSTDIEIYNIVKQRIFKSIDEKIAKSAAQEYLQTYRASRINLPDSCKDANHAQILQSSYPFSPELFDLLTKKVASIQNFQRTRGALRLLAMVVRYLWQDPNAWIPMIHPHHIPIGIDEGVTGEFTSRLQRPLMRNPIQADIFNAEGKPAHAQVHDRQWEAAGKPPFATWVARTIFLHSINQGTAAGIRRAELNVALLMPQVEISYIEPVLDRLTSVAWYLDIDPITTIARFKEEPSINKIIAEEKEQIGNLTAKDHLRSRRDSIFANKVFTLVASPESSGDVDDKPDDVALCVIDFDQGTVNASTDVAPNLVEQIFNNTGESGKFRTFRNRLLFLVANKQELDRAIDITKEHLAIQNILKSPNRQEDLSENQRKQLKERGGAKDLEVRVALTNAYRHLFYPTNDPVKAPKGLLHFTLPAESSSDVKGNKNQQDVILKSLKDCQKIRAEDAGAFAPAYISQKVWLAGLDHWTTKALKEEFAKTLSLQILLDADIPKLRETIRKGIQEGQWDLKVGTKVYIRGDDGKLPNLPDMIEFSDRMELYRRGILKPPEPRVIELSAQVMPSNESAKPVNLRWRSQGALSVKLYQDGIPIAGEFLPSDSRQVQISQTTIFKIVADYGNGETAEQETRAAIVSYETPTGTGSATNGHDAPSIFEVKPETIDLSGTVNAAFTGFSDRCTDYKVRNIQSIEITVDQVMDYRKITTSFPLLGKLTFEIDQKATIQMDKQFVRFDYQGGLRGFQSFSSPINTLLSTEGVRANVSLKLTFIFDPAIAPDGNELVILQQALMRNPVERLSLTARVSY
ncbi:MAG: ATP-binding protein [Pseudanabaena sp. M57BS1SP1A06MG]|nr:ATP-binding protein [Pseudanabaena sp. M53BS1SP1A06MG]MCA6584720.1 ATP-binding protein [Pseudanabaena sp. M34BS1SP1A06MG]MCA6594537.1 ATP-binding protein [Pseudanabaena sp. M38BS1SP1A06MG]MCA6601596.1 ATP-binding protein [Pseudanabaena sp. M57BS1SP1A06MG]